MPALRPHLIAAALAGSFALPTAITAAEGEGDEPLVADVVIEGTRRISADRVLDRLRTRPGDALSDTLVNDDIRLIERMGAFTDTVKVIEQLPDGRVRVRFRVTELPYIGEIRFEGVSWWQRRRLDRKIRTAVGGHINETLLVADAQALVDHFRGKDYTGVTVVPTTEVAEDTGIGRVIFRINLGNPVRVGTTDYIGMPPGAHKYFADQLLFNQPAAPYRRELVREDAGSLWRYLQRLGYLDARVSRATTDVQIMDRVPAYDDRARNGPKYVAEARFDDRALIVFNIDAGPRYRLRSVRFTGNTLFTEAEMREAFGLPDGAWFDRGQIDAATDRALGLLRNRGYARASVIEDAVPDAEEPWIDLVLQVREGNPYQVRRVDVAGNTITKDAVVRRSMRLIPGELWSDKARDNSYRQLRREGVFESLPGRPIRIAPVYETAEPLPDDPDGTQAVDLLVDVNEARTGQLSFNLGFSSASGVVGQVQFSEDNFDLWALLRARGWRGAGHKLTADASWSEDTTSIGISWTNPHINDGPYLVTTAFRRTESSVLDWDERRLVPALTFGRNFLDNDLRIRLSYSYTDLKVDDVDDDSNDDAFEQQGSKHLNTLRLSGAYNQLNSPVLPTSGWRVELAGELNGEWLSASDEYARADFEFDFFLPLAKAELGGTTYVHLSQRNRWLTPIGDTTEVPFYDRLYGGGPSPRHRGFERNDLSPTEINRNGLEATLGGNREWLTTLELSVPIQGLDQGLRGVVFGDMGQVWEEGVSATLGDLRYAAGIGLRFPAAFPIAIDFAWLLDAEDDEARTQFHFSLAGFRF